MKKPLNTEACIACGFAFPKDEKFFGRWKTMVNLDNGERVVTRSSKFKCPKCNQQHEFQQMKLLRKK